MKNKLFVVFLFAFVFSFSHSCSLTDPDLRSDSSSQSTTVRRQNPLTRGGGEIYNVTPEDIEAYIHFKTLANEKDTLVVKSILPFPSDDDLACYLINYEDSWEMISSDKRTAAVIASGEGEFDPNFETNKTVVWLTCLAEEISALKTTNVETKNSEEYQLFWKMITGDKSLFEQGEGGTRSGPDTLYHPVPGHYELFSVVPIEYSTYVKDHLIRTKWGQDAPYNQYCPIDSSVCDFYNYHGQTYSGDLYNCLAGCVAVAGGQIVKYYKDLGNDGAEPYRYASCATREYPNTNYNAMLQWDKSFSNWTYFNTADSSRMAAVMLANIGKNCQMCYYGEYEYEGDVNDYVHYYRISTSALAPLQSVLLNEYQTDSFYFVFDSTSINLYDYIEELLENDYPSIVGAYTNSFYEAGHVFIVDSYRKYYERYECHYYFVPDDPRFAPEIYDEVLYYYNSPIMTSFAMNWGYNGQWDNTWCAKSGDWYLGNINLNHRIDLMTFDTQGGLPDPGLEEQSLGPVIQ